MNVRHVCVVTGRASEDKGGVCVCVCVLTRRNSEGETRVYVVMEETEKMRRVCVVTGRDIERKPRVCCDGEAL